MFPLADSKSERNSFYNFIAVQLYEVFSNDNSIGYSWLQFLYNLSFIPFPLKHYAAVSYNIIFPVMLSVLSKVLICVDFMTCYLRLIVSPICFFVFSVWVYWRYSVLQSCGHSTCFRRVLYMLITAWWRVLCVLLCGVMYRHWGWRYRLMWMR